MRASRISYRVVLPSLVEVEERLVKAVGIGAFKTAEIKNSQVRAINQILDRAQLSGKEATNILEKVRSENNDLDKEKDRLGKSLEVIATDKKKIEDIAKLAEKL